MYLNLYQQRRQNEGDEGLNGKDSRFSRRNGATPSLALSALLFFTLSAAAEQVQVTLDPSQTKIEWTLGDVLHTVHGTFKLKSGQLSFDPASGNASGELVVDATSGDSGNHTRDSKMNKEVLETKLYPEITFLAKKVSGPWADHGNATLQIQGVFHIHGADHDLTLSVPVQANGNSASARTSFTVPYQAWGMKNPSTLFLRVDDTVQLSIATVGKVTTTGAARGSH